MPITSSAKKALRQNRRRRANNMAKVSGFKAAIKTFKKAPAAAALSAAYQRIDKAAKTRAITRGRAARLKAKLAKVLAGKK